jgi:O-methyltransferase involved in polyketide biosynthesis
MSASLPTLKYAGLKSYTTVDGLFRFVVLLYKGDGQLAAVIEANKLGQLRTGAASAIATRYMARQESIRLGILGTGFQARAQVQAICAERGWEYEETDGDLDLLKRWLNGEWPESEFLIVPPGRAITPAFDDSVIGLEP